MTGGEKYYFEAWSKNVDGPGHFTIGVEIDVDSGPIPYPNLSKQFMDLRITNTLVKEKTKIIIEDPDSGQFDLEFTDSDGNVVTICKIKANGDETHMQSKIGSFYFD